MVTTIVTRKEETDDPGIFKYDFIFSFQPEMLQVFGSDIMQEVLNYVIKEYKLKRIADRFDDHGLKNCFYMGM